MSLSDKALFEVTDANRKAWDESAPLHKATGDWADLKNAFEAGNHIVFDPTATGVLNDIGIAGKSCVQICCNNGRELLSLKSMGATRCLGIDQSQAFLEQARELNSAAGYDCAFISADIYALPENVPADFDVGLITIGVLNWMPDLVRFFSVVSQLLRPGGTLFIYETHPFLEMFEPGAADPFSPSVSYFRREPVVDSAPIVYDGNQGGEGSENYWYVHTLAAILNAAIDAGFKYRLMQEYSHSNREVDYAIYETRDVKIPMCYALVLELG
ncbi:class I SAM-dependent methyltransferase [Labrenzia sp. CE80]|uniref:class I SAM-dependent methyltransferase n=1 Tax=Labrenzia sp. CE80 TaxID=1788986 RepID=UPI00129AB2C0|nr:class I SAM-dependent methyltransferase [Labrenzia sp. CE80]